MREAALVVLCVTEAALVVANLGCIHGGFHAAGLRFAPRAGLPMASSSAPDDLTANARRVLAPFARTEY